MSTINLDCLQSIRIVDKNLDMRNVQSIESQAEMAGGTREAEAGGARVDAIVARLEEAILTGGLRPGEKLVEPALALSLGVTRGPLREAIRTLEGRRLLERTPYAGVRVVDVSLADLNQILVAREALEGMAARQAAECMTLPEARRLRETMRESDDRLEREGVGAVFRSGIDHDFHVQIARASRNRWLSDLLCRDLYALLRLYRYRSASLGARGREANGEHRAILDAVERREPDEAERLMRAHIARGREALLKAR